MSHFVKTVASVALPILGTAVAGPIGGAIGGAAGGAISGGGVKGALIGGALGGVGGYISQAGGIGNALSSITGGAGDITATGANLGADGILTGGASYGAASPSFLDSLGSYSKLLQPAATIAGGVLQANAGASAANKASELQYQSTQDAIKAQQAAQGKQQGILQPYVDAGTAAQQQYSTLTGSPTAAADYISGNPLYKSLADDAQRRLEAQQASTGKLGSGGTASALQQQLLNLGTGLYQTQLDNLNRTVNTGENAASGTGAGILNVGNNVSNLTTQGGSNQAAGVIGANNAQNSSYQNTVNTLLALQNLNRNQNPTTYSPNTNL